MRPIWSGVLSFGLINIPMKLYSATAGTELGLNFLHKTDLSPIRYAKVCRKDGKELTQDDLVKGYEYQAGDYVVLTNEDFNKANLHRTKAIDVIDFVKESDIDTIYFEKPFYLEPDKGADKAYTILRKSLKKAKKVGVAKFVLHNREHLGVIKPYENLIVLEQMRFEDEIKAPEKLDLPKDGGIREKELNMAMSLIDQLTEHFEPENYHDNYREELDQMIKQKIKGQKPKPRGEIPHPTKSTDLMMLLKESLVKAKADQRVARA
jgi:DNA end-binding protein Ku